MWKDITMKLTFQKRWVWGDMNEVYKWLKGFNKEDISKVLLVNSNEFKLDKFRLNNVRQKLVYQQSGEWNRLGSHVMSATTLSHINLTALAALFWDSSESVHCNGKACLGLGPKLLIWTFRQWQRIGTQRACPRSAWWVSEVDMDLSVRNGAAMSWQTELVIHTRSA